MFVCRTHICEIFLALSNIGELMFYNSLFFFWPIDIQKHQFHFKIVHSIQAIRHEKIDLPNKKCRRSNDYNFGECVERSLMIKAGCQIAWSRVKVEGLPICDNSSLLEKYSYTYWKAVDMERNMLLEYTNCLMPCTFMEYEVSLRLGQQHS